MNKIFIRINGIGFTFLLDEKVKCNLISPAFLAFFNLEGNQKYSLLKYNIGEVNTKPVYDNLQPFLSEYVNSISTNDVFHYVGKKVGKCKDNKLRVCKVFMCEFEYEECKYSFSFLLDKSLNELAVLSKKSQKQIFIK